MQKLRFLVIPTILFLASCGASLDTSSPSQQSIRYLALGDSYTIGESVAENERWPNQLSELIKSSPQFWGTEGGIDVTIIARTGWTTSELWDGIQVNPPQGTYEMVSLLIGVNNQYREYDINEYREEFRFLLQKSIEYAGGDANRVIVLSIPDWGVTPFAAGRDTTKISTEIDAFNAVNLEETASAGAHYVDITPISKLADPSLIAGDGLHPSGKMYRMWAEQAYPIAVKIFDKK